jgi:hypothetical protein
MGCRRLPFSRFHRRMIGAPSTAAARHRGRRRSG